MHSRARGEIFAQSLTHFPASGATQGSHACVGMGPTQHFDRAAFEGEKHSITSSGGTGASAILHAHISGRMAGDIMDACASIYAANAYSSRERGMQIWI